MASIQKQILASAVFHRFAGAYSASSLRREGSYEQSEMVIQGLRREPVSVDARRFEAAADWGSLKSPENYVGYERTENFASPGGAVLDRARIYELPAMLRLNEWALAGDWT